MRAPMGRIGFVALLAVSVIGSTAKAQFRDTLQVGDRVRVRVAETRGTTNLFVGNLTSVSPDTLVMEIPGGKGTIIVPRAAVAEVALSRNVSRWNRAAGIFPFAPAIGLAIAAANAPPGPLHDAQRRSGILLSIAAALPAIHVLSRLPNERWEPVYRWLEGR